MSDKPTLDTNILIYAFGKQDDARKQLAIEIITKCNIISLQVVNETIYVLQRKFKFANHELNKVLEFMKQNFVISDLNINTLDQTLKITETYGFSFWDSMMVAAALNNHCSILYSEDLHHNQVIEGRLQIVNPFSDIKQA
jgi:predicted nucleic acid-binding protein